MEKIEFYTVHETIQKYFNVDDTIIFKRNESRRSTYIKQVFQYLCLNVCCGKSTYMSVAKYQDDIYKAYSHASVMFSVDKIEGYLSYDKEVIKDVLNILKMMPRTHKVDRCINLIKDR